MTPLTAALRTEAMNAVPALLAALDTLDRVSAPITSAASQPVIGVRFADRLAAIGSLRPTIAQVVVTLRAHPQSGLEATNDETLAAASIVDAGSDSTGRPEALALLTGAVALRAYNQDTPWFVGTASPDVSDLSAEFGLGSVTFARGVPTSWRPYYLRELRDGLRDMQDILPALSVVGLNVAFGTTALPDSALAMHDPRTRTLQLTISTSSGTVAHELAHDLDWQTSRRMFANAGGYSTDRAVRELHGALATSVRGLAESRSTRPGPGGSTPQARIGRRSSSRVASIGSPRRRSRCAGEATDFSAVQDPSLPGYAAGSPAAVGTSGTRR